MRNSLFCMLKMKSCPPNPNYHSLYFQIPEIYDKISDFTGMLTWMANGKHL